MALSRSFIIFQANCLSSCQFLSFFFLSVSWSHGIVWIVRDIKELFLTIQLSIT